MDTDSFSGDYKQWRLEADESTYGITNRNDAGTKQFYEVVPGAYGNPIIIAEPDLAFPIPTGVSYVNNAGTVVQPTEKIAGIICQGPAENHDNAESVIDSVRAKVHTIHRFSLSSQKKPEFTPEDEGAILVIDGVRWHLNVLLQKDKNRIINYDAFYGPTKPSSVRLLELADLEFPPTH